MISPPEHAAFGDCHGRYERRRGHGGVPRPRRRRGHLWHSRHPHVRHHCRPAGRLPYPHDHHPPRGGCQPHGRWLCPGLRQAGRRPHRARRRGVQRRQRPGHRLRPLLARPHHRRPNPARSDRTRLRHLSRNPGPGIHRAARHQVAAAGAHATGDSGRRLRSLSPDAHRPPPPHADRYPARGRRRARRCCAARPGARFAPRAQPRPVARGRPRHRGVPPAPHLRRRRRGHLKRRIRPRGPGRSHQHPGHHLQRREGRHPRPPPALLRLVLRPLGRA